MAEDYHVQVSNEPLDLVMVISSLTGPVASQMQPELKHKSETRMKRTKHGIELNFYVTKMQNARILGQGSIQQTHSSMSRCMLNRQGSTSNFQFW